MVEKIGFFHFLLLNFIFLTIHPPTYILCRSVQAIKPRFISLLSFICHELIPITMYLKECSKICFQFSTIPKIPKLQPRSDSVWQVHYPDHGLKRPESGGRSCILSPLFQKTEVERVTGRTGQMDPRVAFHFLGCVILQEVTLSPALNLSVPKQVQFCWALDHQRLRFILNQKQCSSRLEGQGEAELLEDFLPSASHQNYSHPLPASLKAGRKTLQTYFQHFLLITVSQVLFQRAFTFPSLLISSMERKLKQQLR